MLPQSERAATKVARTLASLRGDVHEMTASTINHTLDRLDKASSTLTDVFIAEGRGYERPSETFQLSDPLALLYVQLHDARTVLRNEVRPPLRTGRAVEAADQALKISCHAYPVHTLHKLDRE